MASNLNGSAAIETGLATLPELLREPARQAWEALRPCLATTADGVPGDAAAVLPRLLAASPFLGRECARQPDLLGDLLTSGDLHRDYGPGDSAGRLQAELSQVTDEAELLRTLRRIRAREMVRITWRDLAGVAGLDQVLAELSWFADAMLDAALSWLYADQCRRIGTPLDGQGQPQTLFVIAMGKLGGCELNFSSDLDLIFVYPESGETAGAARSVSNQEFFDRLGRRLIKALNDATADGFAFRIDMRLRPFGESGALTLSMAAMEMYYEAHARDWERYAMVKGRIAAGNREAGARMLAVLQPFVYRRYVDYGMLQALREMKQLITAEMSRSALDHDIKRGPGGIREIEFLAQVFQLIRGGQEPALRTASTRAALAALEELRLLPGATVAELRSAYQFLRNSEHRLQQIDDRQTQDLPEDEADRARVALGMGYPDWAAYLAALEAHRRRVQAHFADLLGSAADEDAGTGRSDGADHKQAIAMLWSGQESGDAAIAILESLGFTEAEAALKEIDTFRLSHDIGRLGQHGQERLARLLPMVLHTVAGGRNETAALARIFKLLEAVARRSVYMVLLVEHPRALRQLARLMAASPWVADYITLQPALLDELLDPRRLYSPPQREALRNELAAELAKFAPDDLERQMDALRHFRYTQMLKVVAADLTGHLPLPQVSNHLTAIAETVVEASLRLARSHMVARYGEPQCPGESGRGAAGFAIIAYGKLGGHELGYGSDLDLVFVQHGGAEGHTDGASPIENGVFFTRLGQRLIHLLSTITPAGQCYKIDTRLRPSGASGLLVSDLDAFLQYQLKDAWTWEHQALVRARYVAGDPQVGERFDAIRRQVLSQSRDPDRLRRDIVDMRERMRRELMAKDPAVFDLKQGPGGITDIEFMVQYGVLSHAAAQPELLRWTDNLRLLETFGECGLMPVSDCMALRDIYFAYRQETHRRALQEQPPLVGAGEFPKQRQKVNELWQRFVLQGA
jgi:glutamate-ammonia-ligase adenylyltransferase